MRRDPADRPAAGIGEAGPGSAESLRRKHQHAARDERAEFGGIDRRGQTPAVDGLVLALPGTWLIVRTLPETDPLQVVAGLVLVVVGGVGARLGGRLARVRLRFR